MNDPAEREFLRRYLTCCVGNALHMRDFDALLRMIPYGVDIQKSIDKDSATWDDFICANITRANRTFFENMRKLLSHGIDPGADFLRNIFETTTNRYDRDRYGKRLYYKLKIIKLLYAFGTCWSDTPGIYLHEKVRSSTMTLEELNILIINGVEPNVELDRFARPQLGCLANASSHKSLPYCLHMIKLLLEAGCEIFNPQSISPNSATRRFNTRWHITIVDQHKTFNLLKLFYGSDIRGFRPEIYLLETTVILDLLIEHTF